MEDPRIGMIKRNEPEKEEQPAPATGVFRMPHIGQIVHFFPNKGFSDIARHHSPVAAVIIELHPNDPRIASLYYWAQNGAVGSYLHIPHRSLTPGVLPVEGWLGRSLAPESHWEFID